MLPSLSGVAHRQDALAARAAFPSTRCVRAPRAFHYLTGWGAPVRRAIVSLSGGVCARTPAHSTTLQADVCPHPRNRQPFRTTVSLSGRFVRAPRAFNHTSGGCVPAPAQRTAFPHNCLNLLRVCARTTRIQLHIWRMCARTSRDVDSLHGGLYHTMLLCGGTQAPRREFKRIAKLRKRFAPCARRVYSYSRRCCRYMQCVTKQDGLNGKPYSKYLPEPRPGISLKSGAPPKAR